MLKVHRDDKNLCRTCRRSAIATTTRGELVQCGAFDRVMTSNVIECNMYDCKTQPALYQMERIAWVLMTDKSKVIGFKPVKQWQEEHPKEDLVPDTD